MKLKKILPIIFITLLTTLSSLQAGEIYLSSPGQLLLYENYSGDELNLFAKSSFILKLPPHTRLKLLDEYSHGNPLFSDVLQVEVAGGLYKGRVGYLLEDGTWTDELSLDGGEVVLKKDFPLGDQILKAGSRCRIVGLQPYYGSQILLLQAEGAGREGRFSCSNRQLIRYSLGPSKDIEYYSRQGYAVLKVLDSSTLLPLEGVSGGNDPATDDYGLLYLAPQGRSRGKWELNLNREGYLARTVTLRPGLNLALLQPLLKSKAGAKSRALELGAGYKLTLDSEKPEELLYNSSLNDPFSIFSYPHFKQPERIMAGFYLAPGAPFEAELTGDKGELYHYDRALKSWILLEQAWKGSYTLKRGGYYLITSPPEQAGGESFAVSHELEWTSTIYIRGEKGGYLKLSPGKSHKLAAGRYELIAFSKESPYYAAHSIYRVEGAGKIELSRRSKEEPGSPINSLLQGKWSCYARKMDGLAVEEEERLEHFREMELFPRRITLRSGKTILKGYISGGLEGPLKIILLNGSTPIYDLKLERELKISPSLFDNRLTIYGRSSLVSGLYELSFNTIVAEALRFSRGDRVTPLKSGELTYITPGYPKAGEKVHLQLYFEKR